MPGVEVVRGDRESARDVERLAQSGSWDVVVDTSGYRPPNTLTVMRLLEPVVAHCVFVSTVRVGTGWPTQGLTKASHCSSALLAQVGFGPAAQTRRL